MKSLIVMCSVLAGIALAPAFAQSPDAIRDNMVKHLKTSEDFTVKVAEAMPEADYSFKLTPEQMSFGEQMVHLGSSFSYFMSPFTGQKPGDMKPKSTSKADIIAFIKDQYDKAIQQVSSLTPDQLSKTYKGEEGSMTGYGLIWGMCDHATHHRASAEMYLRAKGIKPPTYEV